MHQGCFVWTPTPPLSGRRTPRPGPARLCARAPLGQVGRAGLPGAFWCASPFSVAVLSFFLVWPPTGWGCKRFGGFFSASFPFSFLFHPSPLWRPCCLWLFVLPDPGCPGPWRSLFLLRSPPPFFFPVVFPLLHHPRGPLCCCFWGPGPWRFFVRPPPFSVPVSLSFCCFFPVVFSLFCAPSSRLPCSSISVVSGHGCPGPWRSVSRLSLLFLFFVFFPFSRCCFALPLFLVPGALGALGLWSAWLGSLFLLRVRPCLWCVRCVPGLPSASFLAGAALLLRSRWPVPCVVACGCGVVAVGCDLLSVVFRCRALAWVVLPGRVARRPAVCFGSLWRPAPLCCVLCAVALCCRVAACCGAPLSVLLCFVVGVAQCCSLALSVVRCACLWVVFSVPAVCPRLLFTGSGCLLAVLFRSRWLVLRVVACGCRLFVAGSGCLLLFSSGVCCLGCSCLAAWLFALLCAVVRCGAVFPCAVSRVLWCCVAVRCRAVARCCPASLAGDVVLCPSPVCAVPCCAACRVVRCWFGLCCRRCLALWCVAVCCGASLGVLWCGGAALVRCGVLLCRGVFCGAVSPCGAVLLGCAVHLALLRVFVFPLKTILRFLKIKIK